MLAFLITDPKEAVDASSQGLMLWFHSLVPTLLPFLILSNLLIALDGVSALTGFLYPAFHRIFGCSREGCYAVAAGFLCGYPVGARITADLVREGHISQEEGNYLLCFCNNASPVFLIGYCLTDCLGRPDLLFRTLLIIYGVPVLMAFFLRRNRKFSHAAAEKKTPGFQISFKIVDVCMMNGLESILKLGCYIILFSILARLLMKIPCPYPLLTCTLAGLMEMTNGIAQVTSDASVSALVKYVSVLGFTAFGGLCGLAQTESMLLGSGLSVKQYLKAKAVTGLLVLCLAAVFFIPPGP